MMNDRGELIKKYTELLRKADLQCNYLHKELKDARRKKDDNESGWRELADYENAKTEYELQRRVAQIYGQICFDLGDN